jgi:hypothetical protein
MKRTTAACIAAITAAAVAGCASSAPLPHRKAPAPIPVSAAPKDMITFCQPDGAGDATVTIKNPNSVPVRVATLTVTPTDDLGKPLQPVTVRVNMVIPAHRYRTTPTLGMPLLVPNTCTVTGDS